MKTVIEMAEKAGFEIVRGDGWPDERLASKLKRFAELVRADEREKCKWDIHSCGPTCTKAACVAMREAVEAEREACAKVCEDSVEYAGDTLAEAIRARGKA